MSDADIYRSTPGYVYGVAARSSRMEEGTPPCSCPCHLADSPAGACWYCGQCYCGILSASHPQVPRPTYTHKDAIADGKSNPRPYMVNVPDYYFITKGNTLKDELGEHYDTEEQAAARAAELNRADVVASLNLDPAMAERRQRLRALGETFSVSYGEGHPEARWPKEPGRYAVEVYSERYSESFWETHDSLEEVEAAIQSGGVEAVFDLDENRELPFDILVAWA